jgi:hypothetical protein
LPAGGLGRACIGVLAGVALVLPLPASASELAPSAAVGVIYSDDVNRQASKLHDEVVSAEAGLRYLNNGSLWDADIDGRVSYFDFLQGTYGSQTLGWGAAQVDVVPIPRMLAFELQDNYGQVATDPFGALEPADRQNVNYLTVGPDFAMPLFRADELDLQGRYSKVNYSRETGLSSDRYAGAAAFVHQMTAIRAVSLNVDDQRTNFNDSTAFPSYDERSAFVSITSLPRRSRYELDAGVTQIADGSGTHSTVLLGLGALRNLSATETVQLFVRHGFQDAADSFRFQQRSNPALLAQDANIEAVATPYRETRADASLDSVRPRGAISVGLYWIDDHFLGNSALDRRDYGAYGDIGFTLTPELRFDSYVSYEQDRIRSLPGADGNLTASVGLLRQIGRSLELAVHATRYSIRGAAASFNEDRVELSLAYAPPLRGELAAPLRPTFFDLSRGTMGRPVSMPVLQPVPSQTGP